ncbi:uncharacterized protein [Pocillopora verrucosa]
MGPQVIKTVLLLCTGLILCDVYAEFPFRIRYESLGCYRDKPDIQIKSLEGMDSLLNDSYRLRTDAIQKCAMAALVRGFTVFAVQDGGMCVSDKHAYFFHEFAVKSENCKSDGKGGNMANQVYYLNSTLKEVLGTVSYTKLGCFDFTDAHTVPSLEGEDSLLDGYYTTRKDAISKCGLAADKRGHRMFVVMPSGQCASGPTTGMYRKFLQSGYSNVECTGMALWSSVYLLNFSRYDDRGANNVEVTVPPEPLKYTSIGCFLQSLYMAERYRLLVSYEGQDPLLKDFYQLRKNAIEKCATVAKRRGYKVFALINGGKCLTGPKAHTVPVFKTFRAKGCESHGKGSFHNLHVYVVGELRNFFSAIPYTQLGCYKNDTNMLDIEQMDPDVLDGDYKLRKDAIGKCKLAAIKRRSEVFAIQDGGKCLITRNSFRVFDGNGILQDCKSDGKGGPGTSNAYVIGKISELRPMLTNYILNEGCYKDLPIRAMESLEGKDPILLDGNYASRDDAVLKCLLLGRKLGYLVVGVQDGGMCVGSTKVKTYKKYGVSHDCRGDRKGGPWASEVYLSFTNRITDFLAGVTYESKGCYKDQEARAISSLEGKDVLLSDSYTEREDAIQKCAVAAIIRGYITFGIQNGGMCVSGPNAHQTYSKYGESMDCKNDGEGGPWANQVYNLVGRVDDIFESVYRLHVGCFDDMQAQRIPSLMQDPVLNITITSDFREIHAHLNLSQQEDRFNVKCALATWRRGYKAYVVTADGQCASGPDTHTNIVKFGYGLEECSTVPANNKAYLVGPGPFIPPFEGLHVEYESVGCYEDKRVPAIENATPLGYDLLGYYINKMKGNEIQKCALYAKLIGYKVFAIQNGGECLTSATAHKTYSKYGESRVCKGDGKGGPFANQVYRLSERKG